MSFELFMRKNKKVKENVKYAVTKSLTDENGTPLEWEIKPLTTKINEEIRVKCTKEVLGKNGKMTFKLDTKAYMLSMLVNSVVYPDLNNSELQDSYGVMTAEELLLEMVDNTAEYNAFAEFIQEYNGYTETITDKIQEAKN